MTLAIERNQWHTVAEGENLFLIAKQAGFRNYQAIYTHEKNIAFRRHNPDPYSVHVGDRIWIPEKRTNPGLICATGAEHKFVVKTLKALLHLVLEDPTGKPYANKRYEVWVEGQRYGNGEHRTTADGVAKAEVPVTPELELKIWLENDLGAPTTYLVRTGDLDPIDTIAGAQDRLNNLGYECDDEPGEMGPNTVEALKAFQVDFGLEPTGTIDNATRAKLQKEHDVQ